MSDHGPVQEEYRAQINALGTVIDEFLNPDGEKKTGFAILMFEFGDTGRVNYLSNAERGDMLSAMHELLARFEGRHIDVPGHS